MPTFEDMAQSNPNIRDQYDQWRQARAASGEDATNWTEFRRHLQGIGAPDPGETQPDDFVGADFGAARQTEPESASEPQETPPPGAQQFDELREQAGEPESQQNQ